MHDRKIEKELRNKDMTSMDNVLFTFLHVPDLHFCETHDVLTPFIESVHAQRNHPRPDFIVFGGDNINGHYEDPSIVPSEMPLFKERLDTLEIPYHIICDNHDTYGETPQGEQYRAYFWSDALNYVRELPGGLVGIFMSSIYMENDRMVTVFNNLEWLDRELDQARGKRVLFFSHWHLFPSRGPQPSKKPGPDSWITPPGESQAIRDVIARHGNVLVHYAGHCHVHSLTISRGTYFTSTASLMSAPWEYRLVTVFEDRITHSCVAPHADRRRADFWGDCVDEDHPTPALFHHGLPHEREFTVPLRKPS